MPIYDRDYYQAPQRPTHPFFSRLAGQSVVKWLLIINVVVFLLDRILLGSGRASALAPAVWGNFNIDQAVFHLQIWRFITYQFIHAGFGHIFGNMLGLFFFGPLIEQYLGSKRFLAFYLLCGTIGGFVFTGLTFIPGLLNADQFSFLIGASGSVYGILIATAILYPNHTVMLLFPPIPMKMRTLVTFLMAIIFLSLITKSQNAGGEAAHLGGALMGFILIKKPYWLNIFDSSTSTYASNQGIAGKFKKAIYNHYTKREHDQNLEVDRILDKVQKQGLNSLTAKEKRILQQATERKRND